MALISSDLDDEPSARTINIVNQDGSLTRVTRQPDDSEASLTFSASVAFVPTPEAVFDLAVSQDRATDVDGSRVITRTVSANSGYTFGERWRLTTGGVLTQFENGDNLSDSNDQISGHRVAALCNNSSTGDHRWLELHPPRLRRGVRRARLEKR